MENVYSGLADYGKLNAIISMVIVSIIVLISFIVGFFMIFHRPVATSQTTGKIMSISPKSYTIQYNVNNKTYNTTVNGYNSNNYIQKQIVVHYDPNNPTKVHIGMSGREMGSIIIGIAVVVGLLTALNVYITMKSKTYAAIEGGTAIADQLSNIIR
jgi:hypothetical protein